MVEIVAGVLGGIIAICEALQLFILSDLRDRLVRLENNVLWTGAERRKASKVETGDY